MKKIKREKGNRGGKTEGNKKKKAKQEKSAQS